MIQTHFHRVIVGLGLVPNGQLNKSLSESARASHEFFCERDVGQSRHEYKYLVKYEISYTQ